MLAVGMKFPGGRYHATPWGRHVNEGEVAWPPSSWRLLRALIATWHRKVGPDDRSEAIFAELLESLARSQPVYRLPSGVHAHTRHYMPIRKGRSETTTLVFDAFARLEPEAELVMAWPDADLSPEAAELLDTLLERLGYVGRAESWVEARRIEDWDGQPNCRPLDHQRAELDASPGGEEQELLDLLVPRDPEGYETFRESFLEGSAARKLKPAERRRLEATLPGDWIAALAVETPDLQAAGWSRPPAARQVSYLRPVGCLEPGATPGRAVSAERRRPTSARFALYGRPLPRIEDAVRVGETLRNAIASRTGEQLGDEPAPAVLTGHREGADNDHRHAFYLPEDADGDGLVDHLVVHAEEGFGPEVRAALGSMDKLWRKAEGPTWKLVLEGVGARDELGATTDLLAKAEVWISVTPYLHPWYSKKSFTAEDQLRRECRLRGFELAEAEELDTIRVRSRDRRPIDFHRFRSKRGLTQPDTRGSFWRLTFAEPVSGPLALGFGCHFGLGLFRPEPANRSEGERAH